MFVYDFDHPSEWVDRFRDFVKPKTADVIREMREQSEFIHLGLDERAFIAEPDSPETDRVLREISADFEKSFIRAFHATRLIEPEKIYNDGLQVLDREKHKARVQNNFVTNDTVKQKRRNSSWDAWSKDEDTRTQCREGSCWLTPSRHHLHDGGLDLMFERYGGEFMERISGDPFTPGIQEDDEPGQPTVVLASLPTRWNRNTLKAGPRRILDHVLKSLDCDPECKFTPFWDIDVNRDIPPCMIELVCHRDDARVSCP